MKIFDYKEKFFLFYVAKSINFEVISVLKKALMRHINNFVTIAIFNLEILNFKTKQQ